MRQNVTESMFIDSFRGQRQNQFSYEAKKALFEYFERLEDDMGTEIELDPVAVCCEYTEYDCLDAYLAEYNGDGVETVDDISEITTVIDMPGESFIILQY